MSMFNTGDILETIEMITQENLDVRTVTMGISLLDCIDPDPAKACRKVYDKITARAARLVPVVEGISREYGIPIVNKRISVTPIADRDERARKAAHMVGGHHAALFHRVVQKGQAGRGAAAAALLQAHLLQNVGHTVANGGRGRQRKVNDAGGYAQFCAGQVGHQLTQPRDLEGRALHQLGHLVDGGVLGQLGQRGAHRARARNARARREQAA